MKAYPKYKDSGVEWIGEIPTHWGISKLKHQTQFINGCPFKPAEWNDTGTPIIRIENLNGGTSFNCYTGEVNERYHVNFGDLLFAWSGNIGTSFGPFLWQKEGKYYLNQHIFKLSGYVLDKAFFYRLLKAVTVYVESKAHGIIGLVHVTKGELGGVEIPAVSLPEQQSIATYLDRKTKQIDGLIKKKQNQIDLLLEQRTAVINEAVTKGLNPKAKMKDSGIEWIGEIPAHWNVGQLKHVAASIQTGPFGSQLHAEDYIDDGIPVINPSNMENGKIIHSRKCCVDDLMYEHLIKHRLSEGDVVFARRGEMGRCALVTDVEDGWLCGTGSLRLRLNNSRVIPSYIAQFLSTEASINWLKLESVGTTMDNLNTDIMARIPVIIPPKDEQQQIVSHVDYTIYQFDFLMTKEERLIELLQEYRTSLISEVVTGKVDVRDVRSEN